MIKKKKSIVKSDKQIKTKASSEQIHLYSELLKGGQAVNIIKILSNIENSK